MILQVPAEGRSTEDWNLSLLKHFPSFLGNCFPKSQPRSETLPVPTLSVTPSTEMPLPGGLQVPSLEQGVHRSHLPIPAVPSRVPQVPRQEDVQLDAILFASSNFCRLLCHKLPHWEEKGTTDGGELSTGDIQQPHSPWMCCRGRKATGAGAHPCLHLSHPLISPSPPSWLPLPLRSGLPGWEHRPSPSRQGSPFSPPWPPPLRPP